ncbi:hypothetical protein [Pseudomonas sp. 273]|uniref:hypothetical protein n=1 Tax=Pseudomonas sp. 273 TaxID=75692 RepID=UPI0023D8984F|nr:hypothetical protein [Pseudomonas sp. 273]
MAYTPFNTGNPIGTWGSVDPRDLVDNAAILDRWVNDQTITQWRDRFGVQRLTWNGMEIAFQQAQDDRQDAFDAEQAEHQADFDAAQVQRESEFNAFLLASGYQFIGDYDTDGPLTITQVNQIFSKDGEFWRAGAALTLPYTTVNDWEIDEANFVSVGDAALRQELAEDDGANKVGWSRHSLSSAISNVHQALDGLELNLWEFAGFITSKPTADPATWDWSPAINAANAVITSLSPNGGAIFAPRGSYGLGSTAVINGLGRVLKGEGVHATTFVALHTGDVINFTESSYCTIKELKVIGTAGATQKGVFFPYRTDIGVTLQNRILDVQVEKCAHGIYLENPVHCSVERARTLDDNVLSGLTSQFVAGVGAGQGGTNLNLRSCWFQCAVTGEACAIFSNWQPVIDGCQFERGRTGLHLRSVPGATILSPQFEDNGQHMLLEGCTNPIVLTPTLDSASTPDIGITIQSIINIDGGSGAKIYGIRSINDSAAHIDFLVRFLNASFGTFPTDVLIDGYASDSGKGFSGSASVTRLQLKRAGANSMLGQTLTSMRIQLDVLSTAPSDPRVGEEFLADGVGWNPVTGVGQRSSTPALAYTRKSSTFNLKRGIWHSK